MRAELGERGKDGGRSQPTIASDLAARRLRAHPGWPRQSLATRKFSEFARSETRAHLCRCAFCPEEMTSDGFNVIWLTITLYHARAFGRCFSAPPAAMI